MFWNSLMKKPVLVIGVVMFTLFIIQVIKKEHWGLFLNQKLVPTSCKAVLVRLEKKIPANWRAFCEGNNLALDIQEVTIPENTANLQSVMFRSLANHMSFVARISTVDILEKVFIVRFHVEHPKMNIDAVTEGKFIVKLATLENPEHIMAHLKSTVQVKETLK
jgi:hypothetical protein